MNFCLICLIFLIRFNDDLQPDMAAAAAGDGSLLPNHIVLVHQRSQQFDKCASGNIGEAKMKTVKMTGILILGFLLCVTPYGLIEILSVW